MNKEKLRQALILSIEQDAAAYEASDEASHRFSPQFEAGMDRMIKKQRKPFWRLTNTVGKKLALASLFLVLCFAGVLTVSVKARDAVGHTIDIIRNYRVKTDGQEAAYVTYYRHPSDGDDGAAIYVSFGIKGNVFHIGSNVSAPYDIRGEYIQNGDVIKAIGGDGFELNKDAYIIFEVLSDTELKVGRISESFFESCDGGWVSEGDILTLQNASVPAEVNEYDGLLLRRITQQCRTEDTIELTYGTDRKTKIQGSEIRIDIGNVDREAIEGWHRWDSRAFHLDLMEENEDGAKIVRSFINYYDISEDGTYRLGEWKEYYVNPDVVEEDGKAELFLHVYVARHWQDGTVNVRPPLYYRISVQK